MPDLKVEKQEEIKIKVGLNADKIPVDLKWQASDSVHQQLNDCKSVNISIWDPVDRNSLGINLWTADLTVDDMHAHYFRTLLNFTNSYVQATKNPHALNMMKAFCNDLVKKTTEWEESKSK